MTSDEDSKNKQGKKTDRLQRRRRRRQRRELRERLRELDEPSLTSLLTGVVAGLSYLLMNIVSSLPFSIQRAVLRFVQPLVFGGLAFAWFRVLHDPLYLFLCVLGVVLVVLVLMRHWYLEYQQLRERREKEKLAPIIVQSLIQKQYLPTNEAKRKKAHHRRRKAHNSSSSSSSSSSSQASVSLASGSLSPQETRQHMRKVKKGNNIDFVKLETSLDQIDEEDDSDWSSSSSSSDSSSSRVSSSSRATSDGDNCSSSDSSEDESDEGSESLQVLNSLASFSMSESDSSIVKTSTRSASQV